MKLDNSELKRYARHFPLPQFGIEGQVKLKAASVLCIGAGGLGSPVLLYLAAAGIGHIGIIDPDVVEDSNLQRQIIHSCDEIGKAKVKSAKERLIALNPNIKITTYEDSFNASNARDLVRLYDLVIDGCDNFPTRYLSNDACFLEGKPNIYGSIYQFEGQCSVFAPHLGGACYRCLFPNPPDASAVPNCAEGGVLGVLPGVLGSLQALEAIKLITNIGEPLINKLLTFDALNSKFRTFACSPDPGCALCGNSPSITEVEEIQLVCETDDQIVQEVSVEQLAEIIESENLNIIDVRESFELDICTLPNSIHIPLGEIKNAHHQIDTTKTYHILCHHGSRSMMACQVLKRNGIKRVINIKGGIHDWALKIDKETPIY